MNYNLSDTLKKHTNRLPIIKILILTICIFGQISFGNGVSLNSTSISVNPGQTTPVALGTCARFTSNVNMNNVSYLNSSGEVITNPTSNNELFCFEDNGYIKSNSTLASMDFQLYTINSLYSGYILENSVDTNYCISNELCPLENTGVEWSAIYINEIQHEGNDIINITIPEEIERDYTNNESGLNLDIIGYGYDQEKMQKIVNTQYYTPTSEEMNLLIVKIADFLPLIAVALLIIRVRRVLKKVFRF